MCTVMPSRYPQPGRSSCSPEREENLGDFLQDPEMWEDVLPQPFKMIDDILQDLLLHSWDEFERKKERLLAEANIPHIPVVKDASVTVLPMGAVGGLDYISVGERELVCVGSSAGIHVMQLSNTGGVTGVVEISCEGVCCVKLGVCRGEGGGEEEEKLLGEYLIVVAVLESGVVQVYALVGDELVEIVNEIADVSGAVSVTLPPSNITHLSVTSYSADRVYSLHVFSVPVTEWTELLSESNTNQSAYHRPTLLLSLTAPPDVVPCSGTSPAAALKILADAINPCLLPSGQPHLLTEMYMHNRRRLLNYYKHSALQLETGEEKEREGGKEGEVGVGVNRDESGTKKGRPARCPFIHYLYHTEGREMHVPSAVAIRWEEGLQLTVYSLVAQHGMLQLYPFPSPITASTSTPHSPLICVGLYSGVVELLNTSTGTCQGVVSLASSSISSLFLTSEVLVAGTSDGGVHSLPITTLWPTPHTLTGTAHNLPLVTDISSNSSLHNTANSLHSDGTIVVWDLTQAKQCCQLALSSSYTTSSYLTTSSQCTLVIAKQHITTEQSTTEQNVKDKDTTEQGDTEQEAVTALFCWGLETAEPLRRLWLKQQEEDKLGVKEVERKEHELSAKAGGPFDNLLSFSCQKESGSLHNRLKKRWAEYKQELTS